jgi:hypothetical protein
VAAGTGRGIHPEPLEFREGLIEDLLVFAKWHFENATKVGSATKRDHLEAAAKMLGKELPGVEEEPECPWQVAHLWGWFAQIGASRTSNGFGPNAISWLDILAWSVLTGTEIRPWEVLVIQRLDHAYLAQKAEDGRRSSDASRAAKARA